MNNTLTNIFCALLPNKQARRAIRKYMKDTAFPEELESFCGVYGDFKDFFLKANDVPQKIERLKSGLDDKSKELVDVLVYRLLYLPNLQESNDFRVKRARYFAQMTECEKRTFNGYQGEKHTYKQDFIVPYSPLCEIFYDRHGLRHASEGIKNYIAGKDFVDGGTFCGESLLIFNKFYKSRKVYAFELSEQVAPLFADTMAKNNVPSDRYEFVPFGLSDKAGSVSVSYDSLGQAYDGSSATTLRPVLALDSFLSERDGGGGGRCQHRFHKNRFRGFRSTRSAWYD